MSRSHPTLPACSHVSLGHTGTGHAGTFIPHPHACHTGNAPCFPHMCIAVSRDSAFPTMVFVTVLTLPSVVRTLEESTLALNLEQSAFSIHSNTLKAQAAFPVALLPSWKCFISALLQYLCKPVLWKAFLLCLLSHSRVKSPP